MPDTVEIENSFVDWLLPPPMYYDDDSPGVFAIHVQCFPSCKNQSPGDGDIQQIHRRCLRRPHERVKAATSILERNVAPATTEPGHVPRFPTNMNDDGRFRPPPTRPEVNPRWLIAREEGLGAASVRLIVVFLGLVRVLFCYLIHGKLEPFKVE